jgi:hypothetical protein
MAKLNTATIKTRNVVAEKELTVNKEGAPAYTLGAHKALIEGVLGAFWNEKLYYDTKGNSEAVVKAVRDVAAIEPKFVLQTAAYARNEMYMRTTPQVLLVEAANIPACKPFIREYAPKIIKRADELSEVIAYQLSKFGKPIPNALKKGIADAFANFDEYQLNKYDSDKSAVKLGDVLRLINRKKDYPVTQAMYNYLVNDVVDAEALPKIGALKQLLAKDTLDEEALSLIKTSGVTWETLISKFGSTKETWELVSPNMGYMALLRNLRNFQEKGVSNFDEILATITDPEKVRKSKQLPFRFYSAYKEISEQKVQRAIAKAFDASINNVENLKGRTAILVDTSGSMSSPLSAKSKVLYVEIASVLAAIAARKAENSVVIDFATNVSRVQVNPDDTLMTNVEKIRQAGNRLGGGTEAHKAFQEIANERFDTVILLSDMQCYNSDDRRNFYSRNNTVNDLWDEYVKRNPKAVLYSIDLSAYGTSQTPSNSTNVRQLFGWSDKLLDLIRIDMGKDALEAEIRNI